MSTVPPTQGSFIDGLTRLLLRGTPVDAVAYLEHWAGTPAAREELARNWGVPVSGLNVYIAECYSGVAFRFEEQISGNRHIRGAAAQSFLEGTIEMLHQRAYDLFGLKSPNDILFLPSNYECFPFIMTYFGLGKALIAKPDKVAQGRHLLEICVRAGTRDPKGSAIQEQAARLLRGLSQDRGLVDPHLQ